MTSRRPGAGRVSSVKVNGQNQLKKSNIFGGIVRCFKCNEAMFHSIVQVKRDSKKNGKFTEEYRYIRCIGERDHLCDNKALNYDVVERFLVQHIKGLDFATIIKPKGINPEKDLLNLKIEEEKKHIQEYELGIERRKKSGKKINFEMIEELEDSHENLRCLQQALAMIEEMHVDTNVLKNIEPEELYNVNNVELRSRIEKELIKVIERIRLYRTGKNYVVHIDYKGVETLQHVIMIKTGKVPSLVSQVVIEKQEGTTTYLTPSFKLIVNDSNVEHDDSVVLEQEKTINDPSIPTIITTEEPLNLIDYSLLMNYVDGVDGAEKVGLWLRKNQNFLFS